MAGITILVGLSVVAWFRNIGAAGLVDDTEPLFVEAARQMLLTADWVAPQFNAMPRFDKPPLAYYLMAASAHVFGNHVWAYRLPSVLLAMLLAAFLAATVAEFGLHLPLPVSSSAHKPAEPGMKETAAIVALSVFCLNIGTLVWGSTALSDMALMSTMSSALLAMFWGHAGDRPWGYPLAAVFVALAVLAKGPIGFILPIGTWAAYLTYVGQIHKLKLKHILAFLVCMAAMAAPWYIKMYQIHGVDYISTFFGYHNFERYTLGVNHHGGRPWFYGAAMAAIAYFPWSLALLPALSSLKLWAADQWKDLPNSCHLSLLAGVWFLASFCIFGLSASQLPSYYLPLAPCVAILAASTLSDPSLRPSRWVAMATSTAFQLLAGAVYMLPAVLRYGLQGDSKAALMADAIAGKLLHIRGLAILGIAGMACTRTAEFSAILGGGGDGEEARASLVPLWVVNMAAMALLLTFFVTPMYALLDSSLQMPLRQLSILAGQLKGAGEAVLMVGCRMPSVVYYANCPVAFIEDVGEATLALKEVASKLPSVLVIAESHLVERLGVGGMHVLKKLGSYTLIRVN